MGVWEVICETAIKNTSTHTDMRRHAHACTHTHCVSIHMHTHARVGLLPGGRVWGGSKTAGVRPVWSLWGPLGRARVVCLMCVCVWLLHPAQGPLGVVGCEDPNASGPRVRSQKHGWLPIQPKRRGSMPDCAGLSVCYARASARGGRLCCAWLGQGRPGTWPVAAGNLGGGHPACMQLPNPILPISLPAPGFSC